MAKHLFNLWGLIKPNDWKILYKASEDYYVQNTYGNMYVGEKELKKAYFVLEYSKSRNRYRITNLGLQVEQSKSDAYELCLNKQIELEKLIIKNY